MDLYYLLINLIFIISCFILGLLLLAFPIPDKAFLFNYRFSSKLLAFAYILISSISMYALFFDLADYRPEYLNFSDIFISSTQSLIFTYTLVSLLNPQQNKKESNLFKVHCCIILFFLLAFGVFGLVENDPSLTSFSDIVTNILHPLTILRIAFFLFFLFQILRYTFIFRKAITGYNTSIDNFFSDTEKIKLNWIKIAFYSALIIGLMAIIFQTMPSLLFDNIFTSVIVVFYVAFAIKFINYNIIYNIIEPAMDSTIQNDTKFEKTLKKSNWDHYKQKILSSKIYLKEGITLIEIAQSLNVSRTTLSNFVNTEENQNFNNWINQLRITEAKELMISDPTLSLACVAMKTGFSEQSNFSRQFKYITGETPSSWKK